jgi:hypothetical protein
MGNSTQIVFSCPAGHSVPVSYVPVGFGAQYSYSNYGYPQSNSPHNVTYGANVYGEPGYGNNQYTGSSMYPHGGWSVTPPHSTYAGSYNQRTCYTAGGSAYSC